MTIVGTNKIQCSNYLFRHFRGTARLQIQMHILFYIKTCAKCNIRTCLRLPPSNRSERMYLIFAVTMLTTTVFLHCIDAKLYHKEVILNLQNLMTIDKLRAGYYADLITKWNIEEQLSADFAKNDTLVMKINFAEKLISLPHLQYYSYCENVDLSDQNLTSAVLPSLVVLQSCKVSRISI